MIDKNICHTDTRIYYNKDNKTNTARFDDVICNKQEQNIIWADMLSPREEQLKYFQDHFNVDFSMLKNRNSIEHSARYQENENSISINLNFFLLKKEEELINNNIETVTIVLKDRKIYTIRYKDLGLCENVAHIMLSRNDENFLSCYSVLGIIYNMKSDLDTDNVEYITKEINELRFELLKTNSKTTSTDFLKRIMELQHLIAMQKDVILDGRKSISALLKNDMITNHLRDDLKVIYKDITNILELTETNTMALDNIQNLMLTRTTIKQNNIIKVLTIINVIFIPPTLIASIYGMNFKIIPELQWTNGYYFAIVLMLATAILPIFYFKRKGWI